MILYGISNCDTIKKARKWMDTNNIEYQFHDYRKDGLESNQLKQWTKELGWETLLNRRGTTWRKLPETEKEARKAAAEMETALKEEAVANAKIRQLEQSLEKTLNKSGRLLGVGL